jgi:hypothetical protein
MKTKTMQNMKGSYIHLVSKNSQEFEMKNLRKSEQSNDFR